MTDDLFGFVPEQRKTRADQIFKRFVRFHEANPRVWLLLKHYANQLIEAGFQHYSMDAVFHRVRWHINIETKSEDGLKLNDHYTAYYSRMYHIAFPSHDGFFRLRKRTSTERSAYSNDISFHHSGGIGNEVELYKKLRELI